jgi:scyllo-inositol 2-dehydrogenase (NADP+)
MIRVALLGYGLAGRVLHAPLIGATAGLTLTHVVSADATRVAEARADLPHALIVPSTEGLWSRAADFDVVVIATGNTSHLPLATASLRLGKTTVVDKPLALNAAAAAQLVALSESLVVPLTVFQNRRWDSDTLSAAGLLADGTLGEVHRLESRFTRFRPAVVDRWREDTAAGGGVLLDLGAHVVDQALQLLGPAVDVYAEVDSRRSGARADDDCFVALTHVSGARSHLWASMASPVQGPRLVLQGSRAGWSKQELDGQEDALRAGVPTPPEPDGLLWDSSGYRSVPSLQGDWGAFYAAVAAGLPDAGVPPGDWGRYFSDGGTRYAMPVDPRGVVEVMRVLDAARLSSEAREIVVL